MSRTSNGTMARMTGATETTASARSRDVQVHVSAALVTALAVEHLVTAYYVDPIADAVIDLVQPLLGVEPALLAVGLVAWAPLALVVLFWGRERHLARLGSLVAVGFATLVYLRGVVVERLLDSGDRGAALSFLHWSTWVMTSLLPLGAALAWSIARRRGTGWWPGLLAAAVLASLFRWLDFDAFPDSNLRFVFAAMVYHVAPAVVAGLACWWIDVREAPG
jgi:hypothetical protein